MIAHKAHSIKLDLLSHLIVVIVIGKLKLLKSLLSL